MTNVLRLVKKFWEEEIIANEIYKFMSKKVKESNKKKIFLKIAEMEKSHAEAYTYLAKKLANKKFKKSIKIRIKIFFFKLIALIMPVTFMIYYLELGERTAALEYSELLNVLKDDREAYNIVKGIMEDELGHEADLEEMIIGEKSQIAKIKDAIYGMTDSLVEILALVIGLASVIPNPLTIGLAGLISSIGGTFSMTSGAYLSSKSQNDLYEGEVNEIKLKKIIAPDYLKRDLKTALVEKGLSREESSNLVERIEDADTIEKLMINLGIENSPTDPKEVAITTGVYYVLGALPAILPFFIGYLFNIPTLTIAFISVALAAVVSFIVGIFTAILSGISIKRKAFENVFIILGATFATYMIGTLAKMFLNIEV